MSTLRMGQDGSKLWGRMLFQSFIASIGAAEIAQGSSNEENFIETNRGTQNKHNKNRLIFDKGSLTAHPDLTTEPVKVLSEKWYIYLIDLVIFKKIRQSHSQKMGKIPNRLFHNTVKNQISIQVFHGVCQFVFFTSVSIRLFAPSRIN